jgi:cytochrome c oxidase cbb3-type subunit III
MRALKLGLIVSLVSLSFFYGCTPSEPTDNPSNRNSNSNMSGKAEPTPSPVGSPQTEATPMTGGNADLGKKPAGQPDEKKDDKSKPVSNIDAAALFTSNKCVSCHGSDGRGNPKIKDVPDFTNAAWQKKERDAELIERIKKGKKPMPAFEGKLSEVEIKALVAYVRTFAKR